MPEPLQLKFVNFAKGSYIIVEGKLTNAERFYIIKEGNVFITRQTEVVPEEGSGHLGPGDFFGVVSTMSQHPHIETAQVLTDCVLISVRRDQFVPLIQLNAPIAMKIIQQFSRRMRLLDTALTEKVLKGVAGGKNFSHLFNVAEYYTKQGQFNMGFYAYNRYLKLAPDGENAAMARERMMKVLPYVKNVKLEPNRDEFNRSYAKNNMIFAEGESGDELYIIQKGAVKIVKIVDNNEVLLAVLKEGDIFGEMALLEAKPRAACAVAYEDCALLAVNRSNFERMVGSQPQMIFRLTTLLAERIWVIYKQLTNALIKNPQGRLWDALLIQLQRARVPLNTHSSWEFDFGDKELINMVGLSRSGGVSLLRKIFENHTLVLQNDKIVTTDVLEIVRQTEFFAKMERLEASRRQASIYVRT
jgi:CRP-like cAMP-binding protein